MNKNFKKSILMLVVFLFISMCIYKTYIILKCTSPNFAVNYFAKNNDEFKIKSLDDTDIIFSSDDLLIYKITELDEDFNIEKNFTLKLKKYFNSWFLESIDNDL